MIKNNINKFIKFYFGWNPPLIFIIIMLLFFSMFLSLQVFKIDNDFWFLINTGKYIINNGFPSTEPFTIHSDLAFVVQQWLTDVIFYLVYDNFGIYGMLLLVSVVFLFITILVYKICMLISDCKVKSSFLMTVFIIWLLSQFFITTRPQIFDILFLLLELYLLELYVKRNNIFYLFGLPIISLFLINFHSSIWFILFVFMLPYFVDSFLKFDIFFDDMYNVIPLFFTCISMFFIGFLNPYGFESIIYLLNSYGINAINKFVTEMNPTSINSPGGIFIFFLIFIVFISYYYNKDNKIKLRYLLLFFGTCYLGLAHLRGFLFLLMGSLLSLCYNFKNIFNEHKKVELFYENKFLNKFLAYICIIFVSGYISLVYNMNLEEINRHYLYDIADYLDDHSNKNIILYTGYDNGGYLEYRGYKSYIDPRAEVFLKSNNKKEDIFFEYFLVQNGFFNYKDFLIKYKFDYLLVGTNDLLYYYICEEDGYEIVYEKEVERYCFNNDVVNYRLYKRIDL